MKICYPDTSSPLTQNENAIFLAGPSPRSKDVLSWRPKALKILEKLGYDGTVLVPERSDWEVKFAYEDQVEWEFGNLLHSRVILFWVPREMATLPALTTNVEFGYWIARTPLRIVYGRPDGAPHTKYLDWLYTNCIKVGDPQWFDIGKWIHPESSLAGTLKLAVEMTRFTKE